MGLEVTDKRFVVAYWPEVRDYMDDKRRTHYAVGVERKPGYGDDVYFVETAFFSEVQGKIKARASLYTVVTLAAKPDFTNFTSLPLYPIFDNEGKKEFGPDCYFYPAFVFSMRELNAEFSSYNPADKKANEFTWSPPPWDDYFIK